jgi:hypothetical protein
MAPPKENIVPMARQAATPRPTPQPSITKALIDKQIPGPTNAPLPRVQNKPSTAPIDKLIQINTPNPRMHSKPMKVPPTIRQRKIRSKIRDVATSRARLPLRTHMQLRQQEQHERIQLIRNEDTCKYLNDRQLARNPKHRKGLKDGRVTKTNTIFFVHKDLVPKD